jgi:hypothetical protein
VGLHLRDLFSADAPADYFIVPQDLAAGSYMIRYETNCFWQACKLFEPILEKHLTGFV